MPITRTNTKRYVGICDVPGCGFSTRVETLRIYASQELRAHLKDDHTPQERSNRMKTPNKDLPEQEMDRLSDYDGHLIVIGPGWNPPTLHETSFGKREAIDADVWVYDEDKGDWRQLAGNVTPIFFRTVIRQLTEAGSDEAFGGLLAQGTERNSKEWAIVPVTDAKRKKLLNEWDPSF